MSAICVRQAIRSSSLFRARSVPFITCFSFRWAFLPLYSVPPYRCGPAPVLLVFFSLSVSATLSYLTRRDNRVLCIWNIWALKNIYATHKKSEQIQQYASFIIKLLFEQYCRGNFFLRYALLWKNSCTLTLPLAGWFFLSVVVFFDCHCCRLVVCASFFLFFFSAGYGTLFGTCIGSHCDAWTAETMLQLKFAMWNTWNTEHDKYTRKLL